MRDVATHGYNSGRCRPVLTRRQTDEKGVNEELHRYEEDAKWQSQDQRHDTRHHEPSAILCRGKRKRWDEERRQTPWMIWLSHWLEPKWLRTFKNYHDVTIHSTNLNLPT